MILIIGFLAGFVLVFNLTVGDFSWQNSLVGFVLSVALMWLFRKQIIPRPLPRNDFALHLVIYAPVLFWYLVVDIIRGTWQVVMTTLGIHPLRNPGIVRVPLGAHSLYGVGPVGFFITLSPGSFLVEIDWEEKQMLVHVIDASDPDRVRYDAEKYFRLWEYGPYIPKVARMDIEKEDGPDA